MARSRGYVWTINNPTGWDDSDIERLIAEAQYVCYGKEQGDEGTPHYQGYVYFTNLKSFLQVKNLIPRAHIEPQKGTCDQAIEYCQKDGEWKEFGQRPVGPKGQKNKYKACIELARAGKFQEIEDQYPGIFLRLHSKLLSLRRPVDNPIIEVLVNEWWVGKTGTGKSRRLWAEFPNHYSKSLNKWWDGYEYEDVVAIEEWSPKNECTSSQLKIWADRYPFTAEIKGGTLQKVRPKKIIVLSNYTIEECFPNSQDLEPIKRRFKVVNFASL